MLTKALIGIIVTMLVGGGLLGGFFHWKHQREVSHLTRQIGQLEGEKQALEIQAKAQEATIEHLQKTKVVKARVTHEKKEVKQAVDIGDFGRTRELYQRYRVRPKGKDGIAEGGRGSGTGHSATNQARTDTLQ
jgi:hypothetical protein